MVKIYKIGTVVQESIAMGELLKDQKNSFTIHSSDMVFSKKEYRYETVQ